MDARQAIEILAIILTAGLVAEVVATFLRLPRMVVLLAAGVLLGPEVLGALDVTLDALGVQLLLTLGVSVILFYGGLGLSFPVLSRVGIGLGLLALPGVVVTALIVGGVASVAFGLPFEVGFLIGAVVAPTDPAILIPLFERLRVRDKVVQTVVAESALNDPIAAVLALTIAAYISAGEASLTEPLADFAGDLAISLVLGVLIGVVLAAALSERRFGIWREAPALVLAAAVADSYLSADFAGGSGFLGAFVAGVIAGNAGALGLRPPPRRERELALFGGFVSELVVIFIFVVLGANLPLGTVAENLGPGLVVIVALLVVARPLVVAGSLLADRRGRWTPAEIAFVSWTRETGIVPASVAALLIAEGVPSEDELLTVVALAVVVTLLLQATTKGWLAQRLALTEPPDALEPPGG